MEINSNDLLINNKLFGNNFSFGISKSINKRNSLFLKIFIFLCLFIYLTYEFNRQNNGIKLIISLIKIYLSNEHSIISTKEKNMITEIYLDKYETDIYNNIKDKIIGFPCNQMWGNQREFLNGVVRRFRPKKIVEIGVAEGCASSIILNAIQDLNNSHLYSIDLNDNNSVGKCVKSLFPNFLSKWTLYKGNIAAKFMKDIGNDIDMVFIDSAHFEPGEILDFIMVLPFLSEEAIIVIHDIANQITATIYNQAWVGKRNEWAPYIIFNSIRGKIYLPSGNKLLTHNIGAKKLYINQKQYFHDYFRVLGGQWQYFPKENYIQEMYEYFKEYYDSDCLNIFNEAVNFNRIFVKDNPKTNLYKYNSN
jgi:predicted O-methyltransferase YrrM